MLRKIAWLMLACIAIAIVGGCKGAETTDTGGGGEQPNMDTPKEPGTGETPGSPGEPGTGDQPGKPAEEKPGTDTSGGGEQPAEPGTGGN